MPDDYIESLREDYPPQLIEAYLNGEFVNLTSGAVYPDFSRELNHSPTILLPNEALHVGLDFNVKQHGRDRVCHSRRGTARGQRAG
ncbi:hypothetical protein ACFS07_10355 [Undibacterium arcticum]